MTPDIRRLLVAVATVGVTTVESVSLSPLSTAAAQPQPSRIALAPCHIDLLAEQVLCGVHEVFADRERQSGARVPIHIAVLPALHRRVERDPLFLMAGGPGQGARGLAPVAARYFREVRRHRDIVLVDLRGTGASGPLQCGAAGNEVSFLKEEDAADLARQCLQEIDGDPRLYTHQQSLADLNEIRAALGYDRINLWGGSWGTRAALLFALRYPEVTRTVILDGAVALTMGFPRTASADAQAALDRLIDRCREDARCRTTFPDPRAEIARFFQRFSGDSVTVAIRHPRTHSLESLTLSRGVAADIIRGALYTPRDAAAVLYLIKQAADGDFAPLLAQMVRTASVTTDDMALGATLTVLCSEDLPSVAAIDFATEAAGSVFGTTYADLWRARCAAWRAGPRLPESSTITSDVPALILSGGHDPVTPPRAGELMTRHFPRHRHVVVPNAAHNASFSGCVPSLIARFLADGQGDALDDACASRLQWPPFVAGTAGTHP
jgi:pimeloyl-ACP methyl ester carboxylesterase